MTTKIVLTAQGRRGNKTSPKITNQNQKKQRKNKRKNRSKGSNMSQLMAGSLPMHPCALMYAKGALNPWDPSLQGRLCIPDDNDQPSFKFTSRVRGVMTVGSAGIGFIAANPQAMATNTLNSVTYSTAAFTAAAGGFPVNNATNCLQQVSNGFNNSTVGTAFMQRIVSCGLKIRYTGTELNRGGQIVMSKATTSNFAVGGDSLGGQSISTVLTRFNTRSDPCDRSWKGVVWTPNTPTERNYQTPQAVDDVYTSATGMILGGVVTGVAGNTFEYDCICHSELIQNGSSATALPNMSASDSDSSGYSYIRNFLGGLYQDEVGEKVFKAFVSRAQKELLRHVNPQARLQL